MNKKIYNSAHNSLSALKYIIVLVIVSVLVFNFTGCGGGGGGDSVPSPGGASASGPSITLEGEIDPVSLGLDASSLSAPGASRAGSADLSQLSVVVLENKAYMDFRRSIAGGASASLMSGPAYAPSYQSSGDFGRLLNSGAVIASSDKINAADGKLNYSINIPVNDNTPDATLAIVDKNNGIAMLLAPLGCLPDKSFFASDPAAAASPAAGGVSRIINYGSGMLTIKDFEINSQTTVLSMANIENNMSSNINFFSSAVKKIFSSQSSSNKVFSSKDPAVTNISTVNKVVSSWFKDSSSINQFSNAVTTVNKVFNSNSVSKDNQKTLASLLKSKTSFIGGTLDCFTNCVKNYDIVKSVPNITTSINIGGTIIDSRSTSAVINKVFSKMTSAPVDLNPPRLTSVSVSPSAAAAGETVTLSINSDKALASEPIVYIFGRKAAVYKISDSEYAARVDVEEADKVFSFSIEPVIGVNGKTSSGIIVVTTDSSKVVILKPAAAAAPVAGPPAGSYDEAVKVGLVTKTPGAFIRYTTDGTTPSASVGTIYQDRILVNSNMVINAVAVLNGSQSSVMTASYRIMTPPPKVSAPRFDIAGGSYNRAQTVTITTDTPGAFIRYTLDGSAPKKTSGILYSAPVSIKESAELNAAAFADNMADSSVTTAYYDIDNSPREQVAAPVIRPAGGVYDKPQAVSISCATPGALIKFTLDGRLPSFSTGEFYSSSFMLNKSSVVNAIAFKDGMADSDISNASFEITGEVSTDPPLAMFEIEPKRGGTAVNSDFDIIVAAAPGWHITAAVSGNNVLDGVSSVNAVNNMAVLPVDISKLVEGETNEIKIKAAGANGESKGELSVRVKKDTIAPRRVKLSAASSNASGPSVAELGDRIVISLVTDEAVKNVTASMMGKPVTIRNTDDRNWTIARYLDGSEFAVDFDFMITFTDLAGNSISSPLTKKDINEGEQLIIKKGGGAAGLYTISLKDGAGKLYLSAVPLDMEYCLNGGIPDEQWIWYSGADAEVDLSGVSHGSEIYVRRKGDDSTIVKLGIIFKPPVYGMDEENTPNRWAFDASLGAIVMSAPFGIEERARLLMFNDNAVSVHVYTGANESAGVLLTEGFLEPIMPDDTGKFVIPLHVRSAWNAGEYISYYLSSNNGTPDYTDDDIYVQPARGVAVKSAPFNSSLPEAGNFIYDGRSNELIFNNSGGFISDISIIAALNSGEAELLSPAASSGVEYSAGPTVSYKLPWQSAAGDILSVAFSYKDKSVSQASKVFVYGAPENLAEGFGNFSIKALLGQVAITNFDGARDGFSIYISVDDGASWRTLGTISAGIGQNFDITMNAASKIKMAVRDKKGNFSLTQKSGAAPAAAPVNAISGGGTYKIEGHAKKISVDNSDGSLTGFNIFYSTDGGAGWNSTEAVSDMGINILPMNEYIQAGNGVRVALLEWKTGNVSFASNDYILKEAANRLTGAVAGDFTVNAALKKVAVNNNGGALDGYTVYINGAEAGKISAGAEDNVFAYEPGASNEVELYYAEPGGNTWLTAKSKPVMKPRNNMIADGDFFVDAAGGKITFKNPSGKASGLVPLVSTDGGNIWKDVGPALISGDNEFALKVLPGDKVCAAFGDSNGNIGAASEFYNAAVPKLNTPVKMLLAGDGGADAKAGVIAESGKSALTLRPGVMLNAGESLKVTLSNGGAVTIAAKASLDGVIPVFGASTPGIIYETGAPGNGNAVTGSFNLNNPGGVPVAITGTVEVMAVYTDALGNSAPESKAYIAADKIAPLWVAGYPAIAAPEYFKLKVSLAVNEDGKIYLICLKASEAAPTAAQVKAGQNAFGASVAAGMKAALDYTVEGGALAHIFAGLDNNTEYAVYAVAEDGYENLQTQPAVVKLKTLNNVAPIWVADYPKAETPDFNKIKVSVKDNETGSVYLACLKSGAAALTAAQVKAGIDASGAALNAAMKAVIAMDRSDSEAVHIFSGLESAVEYDIYAVAEDEYGAIQANPAVVTMKTIDNLPPAWASGYPQGQPTGYTSVRLSATVDKKALIYAVCLSANAPEPSVAQVITGKNASDVELASNLKGTVEVAANNIAYINFTNLGVGTSYDIFSAAVNEYGIAQAAVSKTRVNTIALIPPSVSSVQTSADGTKILVKFNKIISSSLPAAPAGFTATLGSSYDDVVTAVALNADDKSIVELTLTKAVGSDMSTVKLAYTRGASGVKCTEGLELSNFAARAVTNNSTFVSLAKFEIAAIAAQKTGVNFSITVTAKDANNNTNTVYDSGNGVYESVTANLTNSTNKISPTVTGNFTNGVWTGNVKISKAKNGDTITASKGAITTPAPPSFNVGLSPVTNVIVSDSGGNIKIDWTNPPDTDTGGMDIEYIGPIGSGTYLVNWFSGPQTSYTPNPVLSASNAYKFTLKLKDSGFTASTTASWYRGTPVLLLKDAVFEGNNMVLTPEAEGKNGIAVFENKVDVTKDFTVDFTFKIENPSGGGADGIIFMATKYTPSELQAFAPAQWINSYINNCFYVDFDTYLNGGFDTQAHSISIKYPDDQSAPLGTDPTLNIQKMTKTDREWLPGNTTTEFHATSEHPLRYVRIKYTAVGNEWKVYYSQSAIAGEGDVKITHSYNPANISLIDGKYLYLGVSGITGAAYEKHSLTSLTISN